jgi:hypothetical protein
VSLGGDDLVELDNVRVMQAPMVVNLAGEEGRCEGARDLLDGAACRS